MRRDVFQAIADPNRREIIALLAKHKSMRLNEVAAQFAISRPAVSKHLKILVESGLITIETVGRERYCAAQLKPIKEIFRWAEKYQRFWTKPLPAKEFRAQKQAANVSKNGRASAKKGAKKESNAPSEGMRIKHSNRKDI